jgi:rubrerythrin
MFKKMKSLKNSVVDTVSETVDGVKTKMAESEEQEMVSELKEKMNETGICPVCGTVHSA